MKKTVTTALMKTRKRIIELVQRQETRRIAVVAGSNKGIDTHKYTPIIDTAAKTMKLR